jgi:hypothetical protein
VTECRRCGAKATLFLCQRCTDALQRTLAELPWWLNRLTEAAIGQTRMADNGGRRSARRKDLDGDAPLASMIELLPAGDDLDKARAKRQRVALAHALATGGINARASELLGAIADSLGYWVRVMCEHRGILAPTNNGAVYGALWAKWLAVNVAAIAASEEADDIAGDIHGMLEDIVTIVNRPIPVRELGPCPTWDEQRNGPCRNDLRAPADALETYCRRCKTTHGVNRLLLARFAEAERSLLTFDRLCKVNKMQPGDFQIPLRTLQHWRRVEVLKPRGWMRPDGRHGIARHTDDDQPLYSWADVRTLRVSRPQKARTGAAAHRQ